MVRFRKILIANRGEIAVRVIRACREMGIRTVAVYSDVDRESMHVKLADEAVCIGPAPSAQSYLNIPAILTAAEITDSDAIHPGYGFLSENAQFADNCESSGIKFIGPTPENIRQGGDKSEARKLMKQHSIPIVPGSDGPVKNAEEALEIAAKVGFPVILKATAGGGGRGMKIVNEEKDMEHAFFMAEREASTAFGRSELYVEKYIKDFRHIEVQIMADTHGNIIHLGERDCSIQRRHQKLIEEAPSPISTDAFRKRIGELAVSAAKAFKYTNVGTMEFIVESEESIYFMEINTRVQVEHPVTETITGIDIIKEQIRLAAGLKLEYRQSQIKFAGHAIEFRINAEDPVSFIPSPGRITFFYQPGGAGVRVDTAVTGGSVIPSHYDSLVAKLIVFGSDRTEAVIRAQRALEEFKVEGIKTTVDFHRKILATDGFQSGKYDNNFIQSLNAKPAEEQAEQEAV